MRDSFAIFSSILSAITIVIGLFEVIVVESVMTAFIVSMIGLFLLFVISIVSFIIDKQADLIGPPRERPKQAPR